MRTRPGAMSLLVALLPACENVSLDPAGPSIPDSCIVKADNPHQSEPSRRVGRRTIIGKGWFRCSTALQDAEIRVEVQVARADGAWRHRVGPGDGHRPVRAKKKYMTPVEIPAPKIDSGRGCS